MGIHLSDCFTSTYDYSELADTKYLSNYLFKTQPI